MHARAAKRNPPFVYSSPPSGNPPVEGAGEGKGGKGLGRECGKSVGAFLG